MPHPTPPSRAVLAVRDLGIDLGGRMVLTGIDLDAAAGAVTTLLGPNGAGKTTLIRCCSGILTADRGTVIISGMPVPAALAHGEVGVMPQQTGAWSGIRPLELLAHLAGLHENPLEVAALADLLGLHDFARTPYRRLSGGQQQAVNLAGALVGRPSLLVLDEPTSGMDPHARRVVHAVVRAAREAGVAVLLTTHDMAEAAELADVVHILDSGRIVLSGSTDELTADGGDLESVFLSHTTARMRP